MKKMVLFAVAVVMAGCGRSGTPRTNGDAAAAATGGMAAGGDDGATGASGGGGTNIAASTTASGGTGGTATGSGGAILLAGSSGSSGGTGGETTARGGIASSGGSLDASGGRSGGTTGTGGGGSVSGGNAGGSGGQSGGAKSTGGGGSVSGGSAGFTDKGGGGSVSGGSGGRSGGSTGTAGGAAGNGGAAGTGGTVAPCGGCQPLEVCTEELICVAESRSAPANPNPFLIDATEVTRGQYAAWLATNPDPSTTRLAAPECSWNVSFTPDATCMANPSVCQGTGCANHPQVCIDMCDALSYCDAVGKQLCSVSQWSSACTLNGVNQHTYGNTFAPGKCHDFSDPNSSMTVPVGSMPECQSSVPGFTGVFDLEGNVSEWVDECTGSAGAADMCETRGSTFGVGAATQDCSTSGSLERAGVFFKLGFRCCTGLVH
jgi:formylglycine-generating enzyme